MCSFNYIILKIMGSEQVSKMPKGNKVTNLAALYS